MKWKTEKHNKVFWELLLGQFFGCIASIELISTGAAASTAPKNSAPKHHMHALKDL